MNTKKKRKVIGDDGEEVDVMEFTRYQIHLPEDDYDEDDETEERVAEAERRKKARVIRGNFRGT